MRYLITLTISFISFIVYSADINEKTAKQIAINFLKGKTKTSISTANLKTNNIFNKNNLKSSENNPPLYCFDISDNKGYILVSSSDMSYPVLAYAHEGTLDNEINNVAFNKYINLYINQIRILKKTKSQVYTPTKSSTRSSVNLSKQILATTWGQNEPFNRKCAVDTNTNKKFPTGCVATAMAQIMNFHKHPKTAFGYVKYYHTNTYVTLGEIRANLATVNYDWSTFPNTEFESISENSKDKLSSLLYHCGLSVNMNYNTSSRGGSGTDMKKIESALETHFNYHSDTEYVIKKFNDSWESWEELLIKNIKNLQPIIYSGVDTQGKGGHAWVLDGVDERNGVNYFHMNWGWYGSKNTYVLIRDIIPLGTKLNYSRNSRAIINIKPGISYNNNIVLNNKIKYNENKQYSPIEFIVDVENIGNLDFDGKMFITIFDLKNNYINNVSEKINIKLKKGEKRDSVIIKSPGINILPGKYKIAISYESSVQYLQVVKSLKGDTFQEFELTRKFDLGTLKIVGEVKGPKYPPQQGESYWLETDIVNNSTADFQGHILAGIFDFEGFLVGDVKLVEVELLKRGDTLKNIRFSTEKITVDPGRYILTIAEIKKDSYYANIINYEGKNNEIIVNIGRAKILEDEFETNNTLETASEIKLNFVNDTAKIKTLNTNIHKSGDLDFFSIKLQEGYEYRINAKVQDNNRSNDGVEYTCDITWELFDKEHEKIIYDDFADNIITYSGGVDLKIRIGAYFPDDIGTYSIDFTIAREKKIVLSNTPIKPIGKDIYIYPNPSSDFIHIKNLNEKNKIEVFDINSRKLLEVNNTNKIDIRNLKNAMYILRINKNDKIQILKFIKQ